MKSGFKFVFFFLLFMVIGIVIVGVIMGNVNLSKTITSSYSVEETMAILENPKSLPKWISHIAKIETTETPDEYKIFLKTGKEQSANMRLNYEKDTLGKSVVYELNNKGSGLRTQFFVIPGDTTKVEINYHVKGKGVTNKIVLAMLKKSLEEQYEGEIVRIAKALSTATK